MLAKEFNPSEVVVFVRNNFKEIDWGHIIHDNNNVDFSGRIGCVLIEIRIRDMFKTLEEDLDVYISHNMDKEEFCINDYFDSWTINDLEVFVRDAIKKYYDRAERNMFWLNKTLKIQKDN